MNYMKSIQSGRNEILHTILDKLIIEQGTKWMKTTQKYMDEVKLKVIDIEMQSKEEIKQKLIAWDNKQCTLKTIVLKIGTIKVLNKFSTIVLKISTIKVLNKFSTISANIVLV